MLEKKVIVLKEITSGFSAFNSPVSAICRVEKEDGVTCFFLTPVNFRALENGEYYAVLLSNNNQLFYYRLGSRPAYFFHNLDDEIDIKEFSLGIFFLECDIPVLVAYQRSENFSPTLKQFKTLANEKFMDLRKERLKKEKENAYNDFIIAEENYYEKELGYECLPVKDEVACTRGGEEKQKDCQSFNTCQNEKDTDSFSAFGEEHPYYLSVKDELDSVLSRFEVEDQLRAIFPDSEFVKINYDKDKFYVVGVIKKQAKAKYICYGVPSEFSKNPPRELDGYCTFIPLSVFNIHGKGYFMMFQDAVSGECVSFS